MWILPSSKPTWCLNWCVFSEMRVFFVGVGWVGSWSGVFFVFFWGGKNKRRGQQKKATTTTTTTTTTRKIEVVLNQIWKLLKWLDYLELLALLPRGVDGVCL